MSKILDRRFNGQGGHQTLVLPKDIMFQSRFKMKIDFDSVMHHSKTSFVSISYLFNRIGYCQTKMNFITKNITNILFLNWSKKREKRKNIPI